MTVLVTGAAGFIGFHVSAALLRRGEQVLGVDTLNDYYSVALKEARLAELKREAGFAFHRLDLAERDFGFAPKTAVDEGLPRFVDWYRAYHARTS